MIYREEGDQTPPRNWIDEASSRTNRNSILNIPTWTNCIEPPRTPRNQPIKRRVPTRPLQSREAWAALQESRRAAEAWVERSREAEELSQELRRELRRSHQNKRKGRSSSRNKEWDSAQESPQRTVRRSPSSSRRGRRSKSRKRERSEEARAKSRREFLAAERVSNQLRQQLTVLRNDLQRSNQEIHRLKRQLERARRLANNILQC